MWSVLAALSATGVVAATLSASGVATADTNDQLNSANSQLNASQADAEEVDGALNNASAEVVAARNALVEAQAQLPAAQSELAAAESARAAAAAADAAAAEALRAAEAEVERTKGEIEVVRQQIEDLKGALGSFARDMYTGGGDSTELQILLGSTSPSDLTSKFESVQTVSRGKNRALAEFQASKERLDALLVTLQRLEDEARDRRAEAAQALAAAQIAQQRAVAAKSRVDALVSQKTTALRTTEAERAALQARYAELQQAQAQIRGQIGALQAKQASESAAAAAAAAAASGGSGGSSGSGGGSAPTGSGELSWPIPGAGIVGGVGPRVHPVYGYASCHTGVDISAGMGTPIQAAASGTVVSTDSGGPYGNHTLVSHGNGISTMYAHQSSFAVSPGQSVSAGQVIGYVGSTGYSTGPHLHFEVHVGSTPYNPLGWFGGSRSPVSC